MKRAGRLRGLAAAMYLAVASSALAGSAVDSCDREAHSAASSTTHRFLVLAAAQGVFYDGTGPSFVMLLKSNEATDESEMGAVGVYADSKRSAVFGAVPPQTYAAFLHEPEKRSSNVMLRLEIDEPQYQRILGILREWDRRARTGQLLYREDVFMDNILLVKQATEALNACRPAVNLYKLDWGIQDRISDEHWRSQVPLLVFQEMKRRNASLHVPDSKMPVELIRPRS
jgi:hypothetical protein